MIKDNLIYLKHIADAISRIEQYTAGQTEKSFLTNNLIQAGVIRELEIIGEASKRLHTFIKEKYSDVPWKQIAGTRDKLIHNYFGVDLSAVWETIEKDIPFLKMKISEIISSNFS
ncbi:MAG: DUF86 domain-containing protein [Nitrospirae bacterium YQR-1]